MAHWRTLAQTGVVLALGMAAGLPVSGSTMSAYAKMAPLNQYLIEDPQVEIELARSAAPPAISLHAKVLVLAQRGYEAATRGTNGFTCLVERSWNNPFDATDFWNSKMRAPVCYNPQASQTVLRYTLFRTEMTLSGVSKAHMLERLTAAVTSHQLPLAAPGSMAYMMSPHQYLNDAAKAWYPHLMFYAPKANGANSGESWGANLPRSPVIVDSSHRIVPEPWTLFFVPVAHWSDGSAAPQT